MKAFGFWRHNYKLSLMSLAGVNVVGIFNCWEQFLEFIILSCHCSPFGYSWFKYFLPLDSNSRYCLYVPNSVQDTSISSLHFCNNFISPVLGKGKERLRGIRDYFKVRDRGRITLKPLDFKSTVCPSGWSCLLCLCAYIHSTELDLEESNVKCNGQVSILMKIMISLGPLAINETLG